MKFCKHIVFILSMFLGMSSLAGCGGDGGNAAEGAAGTATELPGTADGGASAGAASSTGTEQPTDASSPKDAASSKDAVPSKDTAISKGGEEKMDIMSQMVQVMELTFGGGYFYEAADTNYGAVLGRQFYQGEPVMIWLKDWDEHYLWDILENGEAEKRMVSSDDGGIYLSRADGSSELLIGADLIRDYFGYDNPAGMYTWYIDRDGDCYCLRQSRGEEGGFFLKLDAETGEVLYKTAMKPGWNAEKICQAPDGAVYLVSSNVFAPEEDRARALTAFDPDTGVLSGTDAVAIKCGQMGTVGFSFGEGDDGIYMYDQSNGYLKINLGEGDTWTSPNFNKHYDTTYTGACISEFMMFSGTTYSNGASGKGWRKSDFHVYADGSIGVLHYKETMEDPEVRETSNAEVNRYLDEVRENEYQVLSGPTNYTLAVETLEWASSNRIPVHVRAAAFSNWMKEQAAQFNRTNGTYRVVLEDFASSSAEDLEDYARQTYLETAAGKGPDILCGDLMEGYIRGLMGKGALLELGGLMEASGIKAEDYLPVAFDGWRQGDGIYGANACAYPIGYKTRRDALGGAGETDIRGLMDALSCREEDATFLGFYGADALLPLFLEGSASLWGMVDWEGGACDFSGELFAQILENAKRYGCDGRHNYQTLTQVRKFSSIYRYDSAAELEKEGMAASGVLSDDGCHGASDARGMLAVNAASAQKEGAWEFLCCLLGREAQLELDTFPLNREALGEWIGQELGQVADGREQYVGDIYIDYGEVIKVSKIYTSEDMTQERVAEYLAELEDVRMLPSGTGPVLDIIYEEAGAYFSGSKSIGEVSGIIRNRVQLYLDENR